MESKMEKWANTTVRWGSNWGMWENRTVMWGCSWGWWGSKTEKWGSRKGTSESNPDSEGCSHLGNEAHRQEMWASSWATWPLLEMGCKGSLGLGIPETQEWVTRLGSNPERSHLHRMLHWGRTLQPQESYHCQHWETRHHRLVWLLCSRGSWQAT